MSLESFKVYAEKEKNKTLDIIRSIEETILTILL